MRHRCEWCGRWFASELPEPRGCSNHVREADEALRRDIERFNARLTRQPTTREEQ